MAGSRFPPEIIGQILLLLMSPSGRDKYKSIIPYATVSREWQAEVERYTFCDLHLTPDRVATALESRTLLAGRDHRLRSIRSIELEVVLPPYDGEARTRVESEEEKAANNAVFTRAVTGTFRLLAGSASAFPQDAAVTLELIAVCPSDLRSPEFERRRAMRKVRMTDDILHARFQSSYLELTDDGSNGDGTSAPLALPELHMVTDFQAQRIWPERFIAPVACCTIAASLPRLESLTWRLWDSEKKDMALRRRLREDFARALPRLPDSVEYADVSFDYRVRDQRATPRALLDDPTAVDPLSAALGLWMRRVPVIWLNGSFTNDLFTAPRQDGEKGADSDHPTRLEHLNVLLAEATPNGHWLRLEHPLLRNDQPGWPLWQTASIYGNPMAPDTPAPEDLDKNTTRAPPNPPLWNGVLRATGHAVRGMPALQELHVCVEGTTPLSVRYSVSDRRVTFRSLPRLRPYKDVLQAWDESSRVQLGGGRKLEVRVADIG